MKKSTLTLLISSLVIIIAYLSMSLILTKTELKNAYNVKNSSIELTRIPILVNQINNYRDTVKSLREEINSKFPWYRFNEVATFSLYDKVIISGDTLRADVGLMLLNSYNGENSDFTESKIVLFKDIDSQGNQTNPYDTIITKDWKGTVKIRTEGLGLDSLFGLYYIPRLDDPSRYFPLTFKIKYLKIDSSNTESYLQVQSKITDGNNK
jgi:hypothetical protein